MLTGSPFAAVVEPLRAPSGLRVEASLPVATIRVAPSAASEAESLVVNLVTAR
jgi:hypothetical protein